MVYQAVVLGVLLYATETWPVKQKDVRKLEAFHHCCLRSVMGISRTQQIVQHISNEEVQEWFDMRIPLAEMIACRRLQWLGHIARMDDLRLPKQFLFGWLPEPRPAHGVKLRWRDKVRWDLKSFSIEEKTWYALAQDRQGWMLRCTRGRVETGSGHPGNPGHPGQVLSGSSGSDLLYKISGSDLDSALDHMHFNSVWQWPRWWIKRAWQWRWTLTKLWKWIDCTIRVFRSFGS